MANAATFGYDWASFCGSREALKWNRRDIPNLDRVVARVPQRRVAVQAGGNLGLFPKRLAESFGAVYTFEPSPDLFPLLCRNAPEPNIIRMQAGLGAKREFVGTVQARRGGRPGIPHEGVTHISGDGPVPVFCLDELRLDTCDLIQLDVEGWELPALAGAGQTIRRCRPVLCVEINANGELMGIPRARVMSWIADYGYRHVETLQSDEVFLPNEVSQ